MLVYTIETLTARDPSRRTEGEWCVSQVSSLLATHRIDIFGEHATEVVRQRSARYQIICWREDRGSTARPTRELCSVDSVATSFYVPLVDGAARRGVNRTRRSGSAHGALGASHGALICADPDLADQRDGAGPVRIALIIHRDHVRLPRPDDAGESAILRLDLSRGGGRILKDQLRLVHQEREHLDAASFDLALDHVVDLLVMLTTPRSVGGSTDLSWALLESLRQIIAERAHDPALDGPELAARLGWSLRHVQAQLHLHGTTPSDLIREERLKLARARLKDPGSCGLSIGQIATASGFRDLGTFSNSYQRQYGERPSATRSPQVAISVPTTAVPQDPLPALV